MISDYQLGFVFVVQDWKRKGKNQSGHKDHVIILPFTRNHWELGCRLLFPSALCSFYKAVIFAHMPLSMLSSKYAQNGLPMMVCLARSLNMT